MLTNADCTLYLTEDDKVYRRLYCSACHWEDIKGRNINKTGSTAVDSVKIFIPITIKELENAKGYMIRGKCQFKPSVDHPIRELVTQGNVFTITSAARFDFGGPAMRHWEVYAK